MRRAHAAVVLALVGCKPIDVVLLEPSDGGPPAIEGLLALRIDPPDALDLVDRGAGARATVGFSAIGVFDDGERDVTASVAWRVGDDGFGTVDAGRFTSAGIGGESYVEARSGSVIATARVVVVLDVFVDRTQANVGDRFPPSISEDVTGAGAPRLEYPADGTVVPANLASIEPQWTHDAGLDLFEVRFESDVARVRIATTGDRLWVSATDELGWVLRTHPGRTFAVYVRAASSASLGTIYRSNAAEVQMSSATVDGTGYLWSTAPPGILRAPFSADRAQQRYPPLDDADHRCVGCHVLSRDGRRLATASGSERLVVADVLTGETILEQDEGHYDWGAFGPAASRLVYVDEGRLRVLDVDERRTVATVPLPAGAYATHPDWSPDGRFLVVAYTTYEKPERYEVERTSIARIDVAPDGTFSAPQILVPSAGEDETLAHPSISWDGRYVAYTRFDGEARRNRRATIEVIRADGTGAPNVLTALDERVGPDEGVTRIGNVMPTWLPSSRPDIEWVAFSSVRRYGVRLAEGARAQLWVSALEPERLEQGLDASAPAFWLGFQPIEASNYRYMMSTSTTDACASIVEICNGTDDDCDSEIDEACCTPAGAETCGNVLDDDCDGLVDDGCDCTGPEVCGNGLDDDCDREIDGQDGDCP